MKKSSQTPGEPSASPTPTERHYPVEPERAREVAERRLRARGRKAPTEYQIWCEFHQFPEVLGSYVGVTGHSEVARRFAEHWIGQREDNDRRLYGLVRSETLEEAARLLRTLEPG